MLIIFDQRRWYLITDNNLVPYVGRNLCISDFDSLNIIFTGCFG